MQMVIMWTNQKSQHYLRTNYISLIPTEPQELKVDYLVKPLTKLHTGLTFPWKSFRQVTSDPHLTTEDFHNGDFGPKVSTVEVSYTGDLYFSSPTGVRRCLHSSRRSCSL